MSFCLSELLAQFRRDMDDMEIPYLWSDDEIYEYLDEAQAEFCEEVDALAGVEDLAYSATDTTVNQPAYVTRLRAAHVDGKKLRLFTAEQWDEGSVFEDDYGNVGSGVSDDWETDTAEEPKALITDFETGKLRLYPIPTADGIVKARIYRRPKTFMLDLDEPEIVDRQRQRAIVIGARAHAYLKNDSETYDSKLAEKMHQLFYAKLEQFNHRRVRQSRRPGAVKYGGL